MADSLANVIAQAVQDSLEAYTGAQHTAEFLASLEQDELLLEAQTQRIYDSTTTSLDDIPETAARGHGLVVLRNN